MAAGGGGKRGVILTIVLRKVVGSLISEGERL